MRTHVERFVCLLDSLYQRELEGIRLAAPDLY